MTAAPKYKSCVVCGKEFQQFRSTQKVCSPQCAQEYGEDKRLKRIERENRKALTEFRKKNESKKDLTKKAQQAFNEFIRERDRNEPCISCGKPPTDDITYGGDWDAGHFFTVGAHPELRFNEDNCHKQCKKCNNQLGGNYQNYRRALIEKWGKDQFDAIEIMFWRTEPKNYTHDELRDIARTYRAKTRELRKGDKR